MGTAPSKQPRSKGRPQGSPSPVSPKVPRENGPPPALNLLDPSSGVLSEPPSNAVLMGRPTHSTMLEGTVMVELSLRRPEEHGGNSSAPHSPSSPDGSDEFSDASSGYRVRRSTKRPKGEAITIQANVMLPTVAAVEVRTASVAGLYRYSVQTLLGRQGRIKVVKLNPQETQLLVVSPDETWLVLYDLLSGQELLQFNGHSDQVMSACFSPDGKYVFSVSRDKTAIVWDTSTSKQVQVMGHDALMMCCDYSPDGQYVAAGCIDRYCKVWEVKSGKSILSLAMHTTMVVAIAFSPDSCSVCSAGADRMLMLWDVHTGRRRFTLAGHTGPVLSCSFSPDEQRLLSNDEKTIRLWSPNDGRLLETWGLEPRVPCRKTGRPMVGNRPEMKYITTAFAPGNHIVASVNNKVVIVLNPNTGEEVLSLFFRASVYCIGSGPSNLIALGDANGNVHIVRLVLDSDQTTFPNSSFQSLPSITMDEE